MKTKTDIEKKILHVKDKIRQGSLIWTSIYEYFVIDLLIIKY